MIKNILNSKSKIITYNGIKTMDMLQIGDFVLVNTHFNLLKFMKITAFLHKEDNIYSTFIKLKLSNNKITIASPYHIIYCNIISSYNSKK